MKSLSHLLIVAGGTGGHVFPALAVAHELKQQSVHISWLGTRKGIEAKLVPANDIPIEWIHVQGLRGKGALGWLLSPFKIVKSVLQCYRIIKQLNPDCLLGMGGYVAGPGGVAAKLLGIPLIIHEQNAVAGLTNRLLSKIANQTLTGFQHVDGLDKNAQWVGNPVRKEIECMACQSKSLTEKLNVLILGGSQGASSFNQHLPKILANNLFNIRIWHQTGKGHVKTVQQRYTEHSIDAKVEEFIEDMAQAYQWADVLICRAGAMTVAECCAAGKAAIFIPFTYATGDHQTVNAQALVDAGASLMISDQELTHGNVKKIEKLLSDPKLIQTMGQKAQQQHKPMAAKKVAELCHQLVQGATNA